MTLENNLLSGDLNKTGLVQLVARNPKTWCTPGNFKFNVSSNCLNITDADRSTLIAACLPYNTQFATTLQQNPNSSYCTELPPSAPVTVVAIADVLCVNLTWTRTVPWRTMPVTSYTIVVLASDGSEYNITVPVSLLSTAKSPTGAVLSTTVSGLSSSMSYSFFVSATSASGMQGGESAQSNSVTPCASAGTMPPDAPFDIAVSAVADGDITVAWTPAPYSRCWKAAVALWRVVMSAMLCDGSAVSVTDVNGTSFTLTNLSASTGAAYAFQVEALSSAHAASTLCSRLCCWTRCSLP